MALLLRVVEQVSRSEISVVLAVSAEVGLEDIQHTFITCHKWTFMCSRVEGGGREALQRGGGGGGGGRGGSHVGVAYFSWPLLFTNLSWAIVDVIPKCGWLWQNVGGARDYNEVWSSLELCLHLTSLGCHSEGASPRLSIQLYIYNK